MTTNLHRHRRRSPRVRFCCANLLSAVLAFLIGCSPQDEIRVDKLPPTEPAKEEIDTAKMRAQLDHVVAAIVPQGEQAWFFKLSGSAAEADALREPFRTLIESIEVQGAGRPTWKLPKGWKESPGGEMRAVTITAPAAGGEAEIAVSSLPFKPPWSSFLHLNVNRWLGQLQAGKMPEEKVLELARAVPITGGEATIIELAGVFPKTVGAGPLPASHPPIGGDRPEPPGDAGRTASPPAQESAGAAEGEQSGRIAARGVAYDLPPDWGPGSPSSMRRASHAAPGGVDISVTTFPANPGMSDVTGNFQRWARLVGLTNLSVDELNDLREDVKVGGLDGHYGEFLGDENATLAAMIPREGTIWFFKMTGPRSAVEGQQKAFRDFLDSVEFDDAT